MEKTTLVVSISAFVFLTWYKFHYSMEVAESFEITAQNPAHQLLIPAQRSDFKNAVVEGVIEVLKARPISITVIDVSGLSSVNVDEWSAVVMLYTWESWKPQADARRIAAKSSSCRHPEKAISKWMGLMRSVQRP